MKLSPNLVFNPPPVGKPEPNDRPPLYGEADLRARVAQEATKSNTCWHYGFNVLRKRIGKHADVQHTAERQFEQAVSARRKALTQYEANLPGICDQLDQPLVTRSFSEVTLSKPFGTLGRGVIDLLAASDVNLESAFDGFSKQKNVPNFFEYLIEKKYSGRADIDVSFLKQVQDVSVDTLLEEKRIQFDVTGAGSAINLSVAMRAKMLDAIVRDVCASRFGLMPVKWTPKGSLADFFAAVDEHKLLVVSGLFGKNMYQSEPSKMRQPVSGYDVYTWLPGVPRTEEASNVGHTIVILGCQKLKAEKGIVFYIDPDDGSDPAQPGKQRIYAMSYATLVKYITNLNGLMKLTHDGAAYPRAVMNVGYALGPPK